MRATIQIGENYGQYLSSRRVARRLRDRVLMLVEQEAVSVVIVDFADVESVSNSFTDGFLGGLVLERGCSWVERHVEVAGLGREDLEDLAAVIAFRAQTR